MHIAYNICDTNYGTPLSATPDSWAGNSLADSLLEFNTVKNGIGAGMTHSYARNVVWRNNVIRSNALDGLSIEGGEAISLIENQCYANAAGAGIIITSPAGNYFTVKNNYSVANLIGISVQNGQNMAIITGNQSYLNSQHGLYFNHSSGITATRYIVENNIIRVNNQSAGGYFDFYIGANLTLTLSQIRNNQWDTQSFLGPITDTFLSGNRTYDPLGVAAITVTASPFTYTNNDSVSEYVTVDGGTVTTVVKNAIALYSFGGAAARCGIWLEPGEAVTITYTVAPTMNKDRK
jgi:hypothetical protein